MGNALTYFFMMQLVLLLLLVAGAVYLLYCLGRTAASLDRVANALETLVGQQNAGASASPLSGAQTFTPASTPNVSNAPVAPVSAVEIGRPS